MARLSAMYRDFPTIELADYRLREVRDYDVEDIYELYCDEQTLQYEGMLPLHSVQEAESLIREIQNNYRIKKAMRWMIEDKKNHRVIGSIAMYYIKPWQRSVCMGYAIHHHYWRQGIAYTCMKGILIELHQRYRLFHVLLTIWPENEASMGLARKLGFIYQGIINGSGYDPRTKTKVDMRAYSLIVPQAMKEWEKE